MNPAPIPRLTLFVSALAFTAAVGAPLPGRDSLARDFDRPLRPVIPGETWATRAPDQVGLDASALHAASSALGGRGAIVRHGYLVHTWGDASERGDVASAAKPLYTHFLFEAVESGRLASLDSWVRTRTPCVGSLNASLGFKDRGMTFRHMANQVSCYGVSEQPGTAFDYNDWQIALFWDSLFLKVWETTYSGVDAAVLNAELTSILQFQDQPTLMAFGSGERQGRLAISPRDFCRFGLLYLRRGAWGATRVLSEESAVTAVTRTLPLSLPRTQAEASEMCPGQRTLGSTIVPDDQQDHDGAYSWSWWVNGLAHGGRRQWPSAESSVFAAVGHDGRRGLAVVPCLDIVMSWNDADAGGLDEALRRLYEAAGTVPAAPPAAVGNALRLGKGPQGTVRLDWAADAGAPRGGQHYHVLRGTEPLGLDLVPATHPHAGTELVVPADPDPLVFYRVVAASPCEQVADE